MNDKIIEVAAVLFENGEITQIYTSLVNPDVFVPYSVTAINHITNEMVQNAPKENIVFADLVEFLGDALKQQTSICAHNASFDMKFLSETLICLGYDGKISYVDTLSLSRSLIKGLHNYKQDTVAMYFGLVNNQSHRAATDAEICGKILLNLLQIEEKENKIRGRGMASKRFEQIFYRQISQFVGMFSEDSNSIFKDEKNKLIHPGEYGRYRENTSKQLLRMVLDKNIELSDGFVLTADDNITTQCDIIGYNAEVSPIIAEGIVRIYPAEEVRLIGEIKSTLSRKEYIEALRKMAENKKIILDGRRGDACIPKGRENNTYNTVISFLICNKLDFDFDKLKNEEIYEGIDKKYWHNSVLSIEDATINYFLKFEDFSNTVKEKLEQNRINTETVAAFQYPFFECKGYQVFTHQNHVHINTDDKYAHKEILCRYCYWL